MNIKMNRWNYLKISILILSLMMISFCLSSCDRGENTKIIVATDLHYLAKELQGDGERLNRVMMNGDGKAMVYVEEIVDAFIEDVIKEAPDVLVLSGDLTYNGEKRSHEELSVKLERLLEKGIDVLVLPGNHDLYNPYAFGFVGDSYYETDSVDEIEFRDIYFNKGYASAKYEDESSLTYIYELKDDLWLLMLDVNASEYENYISEETLGFIEEKLKIASQNKIRVLSFSHQNLLQHSIFKNGYVIGNSNELIEIYKKYGVRANLTGHLHIQHIMEENGLCEIATSSLAVGPNHYGVLEIKGNSVNYHTEEVNLKNKQEVIQVFKDCSYLKDGSRVSDDELLGKVVEMNYNYFKGSLNEIKISPEDAGQLSGNSYYESVLNELGTNHNRETIKY